MEVKEDCNTSPIQSGTLQARLLVQAEEIFSKFNNINLNKNRNVKLQDFIGL